VIGGMSQRIQLRRHQPRIERLAVFWAAGEGGESYADQGQRESCGFGDRFNRGGAGCSASGRGEASAPEIVVRGVARGATVVEIAVKPTVRGGEAGIGEAVERQKAGGA
jgi:hypothetical protein